MCGRISMEGTLLDVSEQFGTAHSPANQLPISWNVKPTQNVYVVVNDRIEVASWGMIAPWSKSLVDAQKSQARAINARSESVHEKPTFRAAFQKSRCLVPATGYYEWASELGSYKPKQPIYVSRDDGKLLAFAAIQNDWITPTGQLLKSVSILTRQAVGDLAKFHSRMPVFLQKDRWESWMDTSLKDSDRVRGLLDDFKPDANLVFWPVSDAVNSIRNDGPELISQIELGRETLF
jgi:putative SOS response-associated peptidase YedK